MNTALIFLLGMICGGVIVGFLFYFRRQDARKIAEEAVKNAQTEKESDIESIKNQMRDSFSAMSLEALKRINDQLVDTSKQILDSEIRTGSQNLDSKKALIDKSLGDVTERLQLVADVINNLEKDSRSRLGELSAHLKNSAESVGVLQDSVNTLNAMLSNSRVRGQWGERMASDVFRVIGLQENINYVYHQQLSDAATIPDYTFFLPKSKELNMDVKFPLDNFKRYIETDNDSMKEVYKEAFFKDMRARVKEISGRSYINPEKGTLDFAVIFVPNESVFRFVIENDLSIVEDAMKQKVMLCSPSMLYVLLALVKQATDTFALQERANDILILFNGFAKEWTKYLDLMQELGKKLGDAHSKYEELMGTRRRKLDAVLDRIDRMRAEKGLLEPGEPPNK